MSENYLIHRELHSLEDRIVRTRNELIRLEKHQKRLREKLLQKNMISSIRKEISEEIYDSAPREYGIKEGD